MQIVKYKRTRLIGLLIYIKPAINWYRWRTLSDDSLKLDRCLQACDCGQDNCEHEEQDEKAWKQVTISFKSNTKTFARISIMSEDSNHRRSNR